MVRLVPDGKNGTIATLAYYAWDGSRAGRRKGPHRARRRHDRLQHGQRHGDPDRDRRERRPVDRGAVAGQAVNDTETYARSPPSPSPTSTAGGRLRPDRHPGHGGEGRLHAGLPSGSGFADDGRRVYGWTGDLADATDAIRALVFQPAANRVPIGQVETATFTIDAGDGAGGSAGDSDTTVDSTSINDAPVLTPGRPPSRDSPRTTPKTRADRGSFLGGSVTDADPGQTRDRDPLVLERERRGAVLDGRRRDLARRSTGVRCRRAAAPRDRPGPFRAGRQERHDGDPVLLRLGRHDRRGGRRRDATTRGGHAPPSARPATRPR